MYILEDYIRIIEYKTNSLNSSIKKVNEKIKRLELEIAVYEDVLSSIKSQFNVNVDENLLETYNQLKDKMDHYKSKFEEYQTELKSFDKYYKLYDLYEKLRYASCINEYNSQGKYMFMFTFLVDIDNDKFLPILIVSSPETYLTDPFKTIGKRFYPVGMDNRIRYIDVENCDENIQSFLRTIDFQYGTNFGDVAGSSLSGIKDVFNALKEKFENEKQLNKEDETNLIELDSNQMNDITI